MFEEKDLFEARVVDGEVYLLLKDNLYIKKVQRSDYRVCRLLKETYNKKGIPSFVLDKMREDKDSQMVTVGLFKKRDEAFRDDDELLVTLSAKFNSFKEIYDFFSQSLKESFIEIYKVFQNALKRGEEFVEITRFASSDNNVNRKNLKLLFSFLIYCINSGMMKNNDRYLLYANTNKRHSRVYGAVFRHDVISMREPIYINNLESVITIFNNKENTKGLKEMYDMLIEKIRKGWEAREKVA